MPWCGLLCYNCCLCSLVCFSLRWCSLLCFGLRWCRLLGYGLCWCSLLCCSRLSSSFLTGSVFCTLQSNSLLFSIFHWARVVGIACAYGGASYGKQGQNSGIIGRWRMGLPGATDKLLLELILQGRMQQGPLQLLHRKDLLVPLFTHQTGFTAAQVPSVHTLHVNGRFCALGLVLSHVLSGVSLFFDSRRTVGRTRFKNRIVLFLASFNSSLLRYVLLWRRLQVLTPLVSGVGFFFDFRSAVIRNSLSTRVVRFLTPFNGGLLRYNPFERNLLRCSMFLRRLCH
mmetsp:Transcript_9960/g.17607  ORF Transcript_9960/g.17607 Transcript_9960/m.17607 type:complete len:284 (+) Transcript_9960:1161-2012(+)